MASCFVLFCIANTRAEDIRSQVLDSYKQRAAYNQILALKKEMTGVRDGVDLVAHVQYARRGSSDRFLYQNYSSTSSPAVWEARVRNERMAFTVGRKSIDSPWVLTHLFPDPRKLIGEKKLEEHCVQIYSFLTDSQLLRLSEAKTPPSVAKAIL